MANLRRSILITAPPQAVFDFHADPRNIEKVAGPSARAELLEPYDVPLREGSIVRLKVWAMGMLPQTVETEIVVCDSPNEFADEQRRGPFRAWRHRHLFQAVDGATELIDDVEYELPTGLPFRLLGTEAMTAMIENLLEHRQQRTKLLLEQGE